MERKELGKIKSVSFGYWDYMFGLKLELGGDGWGVIDGYFYNPTYENESEELHSVTMLNKTIELMKQAKVDNVNKLINKPVEVVFDRNTLVSFRILTEVL